MAKLIVQHDEDPGIAIILTVADEDGCWGGQCTECGHRVLPMALEDAEQEAEAHVDRHDV